LVKHYTAYDHPSKRKGFDARSSSLEAQVANLADEITYYSHDLDDGLDSGLLSEKKLNAGVRVWKQASQLVKSEYGTLPDECRRYFTIRTIIDMQVRDVVTFTEKNISRSGVKSADEVRLQAKSLVDYSPKRKGLILEMREYLYKNLYYNPVVHGPNMRAVRMLDDLFNFYLSHMDEVGDQARKRVRKDGKHRAICDYLAGMTDRYAMLEHERIFGIKHLPKQK
jgi:dGTPase